MAESAAMTAKPVNLTGRIGQVGRVAGDGPELVAALALQQS